MGDKIKDAREALGLINIQNEALTQKFQSLAAVQVRQAQVETFGEALGWKPDSAEDKDKADWNQFLKAFETAPGQNLESAKGTAWGLVNAVTYLQDHEKTFKSHGELSAEDNRFKSLWIGGAGEELKNKALNVALALK